MLSPYIIVTIQFTLGLIIFTTACRQYLLDRLHPNNPNVFWVFVDDRRDCCRSIWLVIQERLPYCHLHGASDPRRRP